MDNVHSQVQKLSEMSGIDEQRIAANVWMDLENLRVSELALDKFYRKLIDECKTKDEAMELSFRIPDCVTKTFLVDYIRYGKIWE